MVLTSGFTKPMVTQLNRSTNGASWATLQRHWRANIIEFEQHCREWADIFHDIVEITFKASTILEERRALAENCTFLLFGKGLNHSLSAYVLLSHGLAIDASLSARNAVETFLMLELFATDSSETYFKQWASGKEFKPKWIREKLGKSLKVAVRDVIIEFDDDFYENVKIAYSFWSAITHSNLKSAQHTVRQHDTGFEVPLGGQAKGDEALVESIFAVLCQGVIRTILISVAVFSLDELAKMSENLSNAQKKVNDILTRGRT